MIRKSACPPVLENETGWAQRFQNQLKNVRDRINFKLGRQEIVMSRNFSKLKHVVFERKKSDLYFFVFEKKSATKLQLFERWIARYRSSWKTNIFFLNAISLVRIVAAILVSLYRVFAFFWKIERNFKIFENWRNDGNFLKIRETQFFRSVFFLWKILHSMWGDMADISYKFHRCWSPASYWEKCMFV